MVKTMINPFHFTTGDGNKKEQVKNFLKKFGLSDENITNLQEGNVEDLDKLFNGTFDAIKDNVTKQIKEQVEKDEKAQIAKGIFARVEKQAIKMLKEFGFDEEKELKDVDEKERFRTIIEKGKVLVTNKIKEVADDSKNADATKLQQLKEQLETANNSIDEWEGKYKDLEKDKEAAVSAVKDDFDISNFLNNKIGSYEDGKLRQGRENIVDLFNLQLKADGYKLAVTRDDNGTAKSVSLVKADGSYVPIEGTAKNHTLETYFESVGGKRDFFSKSNGGKVDDKGGIKIGEEEGKALKDNLPAEVVAQMEKLGAL